MHIAIINDTHAGIKNGSDIFLNYQHKFYRDVFFPYLKDEGIKHIIHLGDYYDHRRVVNFKVIQENRKAFLEVLREEGLTMDIIPGNHDCYFKSTNSICSLKELLGHYVDCVNIYMKPIVKNYDGLNIALLPWVAPDTTSDSGDFIQTCDAPILMGHLELAGFKFLANSNIISHGDVPSKFGRFEAVYSGHYHAKQTQGNITYLGTQYELTWSDCNDPKFFHIFDTDTRTIEAIRNPLTIHKKVYYEDTDINELTKDEIEGKYVKVVVVSKKDLFAFDQFMDRIQSFNPLSISVVESFADILDTVEDDSSYALEDTPTLINNYIDAIECIYDKSIIKLMMQQLYTEALETDSI